MDAAELPLPDPAAEVQAQLDMANSQLALYARDLKRIVDAERQKSRDLAHANVRLQMLDRLKTDFLVFISHELRTPLVAMSAVQMFDPRSDPETLATVAGLFQHGYEHLQLFVQRGLKYFAWAAGEERAAPGAVDAAALARRVAAEAQAGSGPGGLVRVDAPPGPCLVIGNEAHLSEVLAILLDNALKFSPAPQAVDLTVTPTARSVLIAVADKGAGFPPELAAELFRPFTIGDVAHHSRGSGLSLPLAAAIVQAYGGRIWAESAGESQGATFRVELAAASPEG